MREESEAFDGWPVLGWRDVVKRVGDDKSRRSARLVQHGSKLYGSH